MTSPDWPTISTIASTVALVMSGFLWFASKIFRLGKTSQRLDGVESDIQNLRHELRSVRNEVTGVRSDLNQRMDKLILLITELKSYQTHPGHSHD